MSGPERRVGTPGTPTHQTDPVDASAGPYRRQHGPPQQGGTVSDYPFKHRHALYEGEHHGIRWCIYQGPLSSVLNGYARIPDGVTIDVDTLEVHGGITYGSGECTGWVGFDTAHTGDAWDVNELRGRIGVHVTASGVAFQEQERSMWAGAEWERLWTVDLLRAECERLCEQIAAAARVGGGVQ